MATHPDVLDRRESLRSPLVGSVALHALLFTALGIYGMVLSRPVEQWGELNPGGGAVGITPVSKIPMLTQPGRVNPVANDTESTIPAPPPKPKPAPKEPAKAPEPDAIPIKSKRTPKKQTDIAASRQRYRAQEKEAPNQLHSNSGQALVSEMYGGMTGSGGVGIGTGSPFGSRFGGYLGLLRERVAQNWKTGEIDPRLQTAPSVIVRFELLKNGSTRNVQLLQRSGNYALDNSAVRAIYDSSPFPPIPPGFERDSAYLEFWFTLKR